MYRTYDVRFNLSGICIVSCTICTMSLVSYPQLRRSWGYYTRCLPFLGKVLFPSLAESTGYHRHMISVVLFSTKIHLKVCWWIMKLHRWVALIIIRMLLHVPEIWGEMVLIHLFCTLPNVLISVKQIFLQKHLLSRHRWSNFIQG